MHRAAAVRVLINVEQRESRAKLTADLLADIMGKLYAPVVLHRHLIERGILQRDSASNPAVP